MASPKTVQSTVAFQDSQGNVVASGSLVLTLSQAAEITSGGGLVANKTVSLALTAGGLISGTPSLWANDQLTPSGTTYHAELLDSGGNIIADFGQWNIAGASPIDLSQMIPVSTSTVSNPAPVLLNPAGAGLQTITGSLTVTGAVTVGSLTSTGVITGVNVGWSTPMDFGAKGDVKQVNDIAITSGTKIATAASAPFNCSTDVGKFMVISGAGTSAARALVSPIASCQSTSQVTLTDNAGTTVTPASFPTLAYFGTNDRAAINTCAQNAFSLGGTCWINDNKTFMVSGTGTTISFGALPGVRGGAISGYGTIVYAPYGTMTAGVNDRLFYFASTRSNGIQIAAGAIAKGATSFTAQNASDVSTWKKGDTILIHEKDANIGDQVYVDTALVSSVSGTTVNLVAPLGTAFPNARSFNNSGSPATCAPSQPCGLSAERVTNLIQDLVVENIGLIIPSVTDGTNLAVGIVTTATKRTIIRGITCQNAAQNCIATYLDTALTFADNSVTSAIQNEFASNIGLTITGNQFNTETLYGPMFNFTVQNGGGVNVDLGTGFANITGNTFGSANSSVCMTLAFGVHDSVVAGNACKFGTTASPSINLTGGYNNVIIGNTLGGGITGSTGIAFNDMTTGSVNILSDKNQAIGNKVDSTFTTAYSLPGANNTDTAVDNSGTQGTGAFLAMYKYGTNWDIGGTQATNFLITDASSRGMLLHNGISQVNITSSWGYGIGSGSAAGGGDTFASRGAAGAWVFGTTVGGTNATLKFGAPIAGGTAATFTGSTGACSTTGTQSGGAWAGRVTCTAATAASTLVIVPGFTAPNGWICSAYDETTRANLLQQTATGATSCTLTATSITQNDVIVFQAVAF